MIILQKNKKNNYNIISFYGKNNFLSLYIWIRNPMLFEIVQDDNWNKIDDNEYGSLNIILGERSTGKSKLLNLLKNEKKDSEVFLYNQGTDDDALSEINFIKKLKKDYKFFKEFKENSFDNEINIINKNIDIINELSIKINIIKDKNNYKIFKENVEKKTNERMQKNILF